KSYNLELGKKQWESFVGMNSLSLLYLLDAVPYRINSLGAYDAHLAIDVGYDRRFFALSLLIARESNNYPPFFSLPNVYDKTDTQFEAINSTVLSDTVVGLLSNTFKRRFDPLKSLLIIRDGQITSKEYEALCYAIEQLKEKGFLEADACVDFVDLHKE